LLNANISQYLNLCNLLQTDDERLPYRHLKRCLASAASQQREIEREGISELGGELNVQVHGLNTTFQGAVETEEKKEHTFKNSKVYGQVFRDMETTGNEMVDLLRQSLLCEKAKVCYCQLYISTPCFLK
tara:strand:- start:833 stop:1219 length:387 start_codon:yes stop_codon:yes gene_type:complete